MVKQATTDATDEKAKLRTYLNLVKQATTDGTNEKRKTTDIFESDQATTDGTDEKRKITSSQASYYRRNFQNC